MFETFFIYAKFLLYLCGDIQKNYIAKEQLKLRTTPSPFYLPQIIREVGNNDICLVLNLVCSSRQLVYCSFVQKHN